MKVTQEELESLTALINELKAVRRVRTPAGAEHYDQPIGSVIISEMASAPRGMNIRDSEYDGWELVSYEGTDYYLGKDGDSWVVTEGDDWDAEIGRFTNRNNALKGIAAQKPKTIVTDEMRKFAQDQDRITADLFEELYKVEGRIAGYEDSIRRAAGQKKDSWSRPPRWSGTFEDALVKARESVNDPNEAPWKTRQTAETLAKYDDFMRQREDLNTRIRAQEDIYLQHRWNRAFLVITSGEGHVHKTMACSTCRPTTRFNWLPEYSGAKEDEIVDAAGERACTVCYPSAPTQTLKKPTRIYSDEELRKQREREEREARKVTKGKKSIDGLVSELSNLMKELDSKAVRRVRTPEGARRYGQPIGTVITADVTPSIPGQGGAFPERDSAQKAAAKLKGVRKVPNFQFKKKPDGSLEAKDPKTGYVARITTTGQQIKLEVKDGDVVVYQTRTAGGEERSKKIARRAQYEMKKPYIIAMHEQSKKGKRKQPGFRDLYKGRYGVDWSEEGPGFLVEDDIDGRWAAGLAEAKDLGIDYVQRVGSNNEIHFESIETINSIMRVHEEVLPGFTYYAPKVGIKPMPKRNALAYNVLVRGSAASKDPWTYDRINSDRYTRGFLDPELNYDYSGIGLNADYFAADWDEARAYNTLNFNEKSWWSVDPRTLAEEAGYEDWEGLIFSIVTHEVGHTLGRVATGDLNTVQNDMYDRDIRKRAMEELEEIFIEFGLLVEGENIPWMDSSITLDTEVLKQLLSQYGTTNIHEMFAEVWAEYMMADRPRPFAQRVGTMLQSVMQDWIDHEFEGFDE